MQRRSFIQKAACIGACATLLSPLSRAIAGTPVDAEVELRLERRHAKLASAGAGARLGVRATPVALTAMPARSLRVRAWIATDAGSRAFDFASFDRNGGSQRLRFELTQSDLIGFEVASGRELDDCNAHATCGAGLTPGQYRLWLTQSGIDIAAVDLQVDAITA